MNSELIYAFRVTRLPLLDVDGSPVGRIDDVVIVPPLANQAPRVIGFVAAQQRRRFFLPAGRVGSLDHTGIRLRSGNVDIGAFKLRTGEILASTLVNRPVGDKIVSDLALRPTIGKGDSWEVATVALANRGPRLRRRTSSMVGWHEVPELFGVNAPGSKLAAQIAQFRDLHPMDVANTVLALTAAERLEITDAMDDDTLADMLEELPEGEQLRIIDELDVDRAAHVLEEMWPDDAADLLAEMPSAQRDRLLEHMDLEDAIPLRRLLRYDGHTAGGLMTTAAIIVTPVTTVAQALAQLRDPELPPALAAQVFVANPPSATPTGTYLGTVGFQRLLREPPGTPMSDCLTMEEQQADVWVDTHLPDVQVAERLAAYNLLAVAVCDGAHRLVGAVTVDDVLDRTLPDDWRQRSRIARSR